MFNGALVGWWMWWCVKGGVSPGPKRCASSLSKSSPALWYHVFSAACSTLARTAILILPSGRSGNKCICQNGGSMEARERMILTDLRCNLEETLLQQPKSEGLAELSVYSCVDKDTTDEKQLVSEEKWWSSLGFGRNCSKRDACLPNTANRKYRKHIKLCEQLRDFMFNLLCLQHFWFKVLGYAGNLKQQVAFLSEYRAKHDIYK